jgi:hypothetical protein
MAKFCRRNARNISLLDTPKFGSKEHWWTLLIDTANWLGLEA